MTAATGLHPSSWILGSSWPAPGLEVSVASFDLLVLGGGTAADWDETSRCDLPRDFGS